MGISQTSTRDTTGSPTSRPCMTMTPAMPVTYNNHPGESSPKYLFFALDILGGVHYDLY